MSKEFSREINEGCLRVRILNVDEFTSESMVSASTTIQNIPWKICLQKTADDEPSLKFVLFCNENSASTVWNCMATVMVKVSCLNADVEHVKLGKQVMNSFSYSNKQTDRILASWSTLVDPKNPFLKDNELEIVAKFRLARVSGIRKRKTIDYSSEQPLLFNGILEIEGRRVYVNKQLLTMHSKFFESLFFGEFNEKNQHVIKLSEVNHDEFVEFLDIIHPTRAEIRGDTVESLLKLADRFQTEEVTARCEEFLMNSDVVPMAKKLILGQQYRLGMLMDKCLKSFQSVSDMKVLKKSEFYHDLNDDVKSALLDRIVKIHDEVVGRRVDRRN